jgi:aminoglycoside/choline kinase family phosphotransferase
MSELPKTSDDITADWLNEVLDDSTTGGAKIVSFEKEVIGEGAGFVGELTRLTLTYDGDAGSAPASIIAKLPTREEAFRNLANMVNLYQREIRFYEELAADVPVRTPKMYFSHSDSATGDHVLLLEDLAPGRVGDQLKTCSIDEAKLALQTLAKIHAAFWNSPRLKELEWMPGVDDPMLLGMISMMYQQSWPVFVERYGDQISPGILPIGEKFGQKFLELAKQIEDGPVTITHADFRLDNMFFDLADGSPIAIIDWQLAQRGPAMGDVTYFLAGNLTPDVRREHETDLVRAYHEALVENGVADYDYESCAEDYRRAALLLFIFVVTNQEDFNIEDYNDRAQDLLNSMLERYMTAILDLNAAEFLPN